MEYIRRLYAELYAIRRKLAIGGVCQLAFFLLFHVVFGANGMVIYQQKRSEYRQLDEQINDLQKENEALVQRTKALKNDRGTIEKEAREQLRYAKPGEVIYLMPKKNEPAPPNTAAAKPADRK